MSFENTHGDSTVCGMEKGALPYQGALNPSQDATGLLSGSNQDALTGSPY